MAWWQLDSILKANVQEFIYWSSTLPLSCPNDGEPLVPGPPGEPPVLFCRFDGWSYPRDWVRPERL